MAQSTGCASSGSVRTVGRTASVWFPGTSTTSSSNGVRAQTMTSWPGTCESQAAIVPPMAPGPMTAMRVDMTGPSLAAR
jgi:hypothetical protein